MDTSSSASTGQSSKQRAKLRTSGQCDGTRCCLLTSTHEPGACYDASSLFISHTVTHARSIAHQWVLSVTQSQTRDRIWCLQHNTVIPTAPFCMLWIIRPSDDQSAAALLTPSDVQPAKPPQRRHGDQDEFYVELFHFTHTLLYCFFLVYSNW